jgi:hypothetical protein
VKGQDCLVSGVGYVQVSCIDDVLNDDCYVFNRKTVLDGACTLLRATNATG